MTEITDNCIALKVSDYRDDDRLVSVLTAEHGVVTVLLRGVKKAKAKLKPYAQPFTVFNSRLISGKGAFLTLIDPMLISDGFTLCTDLRKFTAASVAAEATALALGDGEAHPDVFVEFLKFLKAVEFNGDAYYQAAVYMCALLGMSGFYREYTYADTPKTPVQMLGYAQRVGYEKSDDRDMSRRALKFACSEFSRNFDCVVKSAESIDLY